MIYLSGYDQAVTAHAKSPLRWEIPHPPPATEGAGDAILLRAQLSVGLLDLLANGQMLRSLRCSMR